MRYFIFVCLLLPAAAWAQGNAQNVEVDPVTCWWRSGTSSVRVGEPFAVLLTCSILETEAVRAVVDRGRLGTAAVQFPPYEVIGGTQSADEVTASRRFIQYEYTLRLIGEDVFGRDVPIPELPITYRIESQVQQDSAVQGREQNYIVPSLPMRVNSLVPADATHIRESPVPTLAEISARDFRGRMLRLVAGILFALGGLMLLVVVVRGLSRRRSARPAGERRLVSEGAIIAAARRELQDLQPQTRQGWTPELISRALAALRVIASYFAGRPVSQRETAARPPTEGELVVKHGWFGAPVAVSGATTATANDAELSSAIAVLTAARYSREPKGESGPLDDALEAGLRAARRLGAQHTFVARTTRAAGRTVGAWRQRVWAR